MIALVYAIGLTIVIVLICNSMTIIRWWCRWRERYKHRILDIKQRR